MGATLSRHRHSAVIDRAQRRDTFAARNARVALLDFHAEITQFPGLYVRPTPEGSHASEVPSGAQKSVAQPLSQGRERQGGPAAGAAGEAGAEQAPLIVAGGGAPTTPGGLAPADRSVSSDEDEAAPEDAGIVDTPDEEGEGLFGTGGAGKRNLVYVMTLEIAPASGRGVRAGGAGAKPHPAPHAGQVPPVGAPGADDGAAAITSETTTRSLIGAPRSWRIRRTVGEFLSLHTALRRPLGWALPDFPREHRFRDMAAGRAARAVDPGAMTRRLRGYLSALLETPHALDLVPLREFLELSAASLDPLLGWKGKEGVLLAAYDALFVRGVGCAGAWRPYWFALRDSYLVAYDDSRCLTPSHVVLLDEATDIYSGAVMPVGTCGATSCFGAGISEGVGGGDVRTLTLITAQGRVLLSARTKRDADDWVSAVRERMAHCLHAQRQPLGSFAPPRRGAQCRWLVDGNNTYAAIMEAMRGAQHEIMITGEWVSR